MQRTLKFVRYLPEFGWEATVLTGPASYWLKDESLLAEVPPGTRVVRAPHWGGRFVGGGGVGTRRSASKLQGLRAVSRALLVPDAYVGWVAPAGRVVERLLRDDAFDAIVTTSSPDSSHLLGRWIRSRRGVPWIADFRDPWTRRMSYSPPTRLHHAIHRRLEASVLREADRIVVTSDSTGDDFRELVPGLAPGKVVTITNGYDEEDFRTAAARLSAGGPESASGPESAPGPESASGPELASEPVLGCPVLHAGQLNPERPLGTYLRGLSSFLERHPEARTRGRTLFLGGHYDSDVAQVREAGLTEDVFFAPSRPHLESVSALLRAEVLLLLEQDSERGALILPGKIFEYLRSGRPILAVVPQDGAAARLVRSMDAGIVVDPARPASVAEGLERLLGEPGPSRPGADLEQTRRFERRELTRRLAGELDAVL